MQEYPKFPIENTCLCAYVWDGFCLNTQQTVCAVILEIHSSSEYLLEKKMSFLTFTAAETHANCMATYDATCFVISLAWNIL